MPSIASRVERAKQKGNTGRVIIYASWEAGKLVTYNARGEEQIVDFKHPQLRAIPEFRRENFKLHPWGEYMEWDGVRFNPFQLCGVCQMYHPGVDHAEYVSRRMIR